jgi:prepilin-type N-terminal cleavage/methylation domain-containing protein
MIHRTGANGFSLIEMLVALLVFSIVATGLAQTIVAAQATRHTSALLMDASQLAVTEVERIRAGQQPSGAQTSGPFSYAARIEPLADYPDLARVQVTVDWIDREPRQLELTALMPVR